MTVIAYADEPQKTTAINKNSADEIGWRRVEKQNENFAIDWDIYFWPTEDVSMFWSLPENEDVVSINQTVSDTG